MGSLLHVVLALVVSAIVFVSIFLMDYIMDKELLGKEPEAASDALEEIILALSVLVGFAWEQSFDTAVSILASSIANEVPQSVSKLAMSLSLVAIVFPAWRIYILPKELDFAEEESEHGQKKKKLKQFASAHYKLMVDAKTKEYQLDKAHLKMKRQRRECHHGHGQDLHPPDGLKHVQVTGRSITEPT